MKTFVEIALLNRKNRYFWTWYYTWLIENMKWTKNILSNIHQRNIYKYVPDRWLWCKKGPMTDRFDSSFMLLTALDQLRSVTSPSFITLNIFLLSRCWDCSYLNSGVWLIRTSDGFSSTVDFSGERKWVLL